MSSPMFDLTISLQIGLKPVNGYRKFYGHGHWIKRKGIATVRLSDGTVLDVELHWYEATGIGKREFKIKRYIK
jgi:hypothetical protein